MDLLREVTSPYFSPHKQARTRSPSPSDRQCKRPRTISEPKCSLAIRDEGLVAEEPLYCFYFRTFDRFYERLERVKPRLIQEVVAEDPWKVLIAVTLLNKTSGKLAIPVFWEIMERYPEPLYLSHGTRMLYTRFQTNPPTAALESLQSLLQPLGLHTTRSKRLIELSKLYLDDPPSPTHLRQSRPYTSSVSSPPSPSSSLPTSPSSPVVISSTHKTQRNRYVPTSISHLPGAGVYALDSYRIFCQPGEWKNVMPSDKELIKYLVCATARYSGNFYGYCVDVNTQKWRWAFEERMKWVPEAGVAGRVDVEYLEKLLNDLES